MDASGSSSYEPMRAARPGACLKALATWLMAFGRTVTSASIKRRISPRAARAPIFRARAGPPELNEIGAVAVAIAAGPLGVDGDRPVTCGEVSGGFGKSGCGGNYLR